MEFFIYIFASMAILYAAYRVVGDRLAKTFALSSEESTPSHAMRDGLDYEPARCAALLPQHFSAIAAAGPIVGPILAGMYFGWGPAWLWIIFGSILIGGIHDFTALLASVRHQGRSIAEVVREYMTARAFILFMIFIWFALIYVIIAFADVTAGTFVQTAATGEDAPGPAVATSSMLYLALAVIMGLCLRLLKMDPFKAKMIFLPLVAAAIFLGPFVPFDISQWTGVANAQRAWGYILLAYCFIAAMVPVWSLLQPRGELGGYFLYIVMAIAGIGILVGDARGSLSIQQPFFKGWNSPEAGGTLFPMLFITVACGACSGFHSIVASGTTSKQLNREMDAKSIGYGSMLLEGFFACLSLATVMILADVKGKSPNFIYASGIAEFGTEILGLGLSDTANITPVLYKFALLCFATFVFDTLDAGTRLARYILMELFGWKSRAQIALATFLCLLLPAIVVSLPSVEFDGKPLPVWKVFWNIFGSSNQLLAALTLLGVTVWLARIGMKYWHTLASTIFMLAMSLWSLALQMKTYLAMWNASAKITALHHLQFAISTILMILAVWLVVEAYITWKTRIQPGALLKKQQTLAKA